MKKSVKILAVLILSLTVLTGCGKEKQVLTTCTRTANQNGMKMNLEYKIYSTGNYVDTIETTEIVETSNSEYLETMKTTVENMYASYKDIKYYNTDVKIEGNKLISNVKIEYDKIDTNKLIEIDSANAQLIKDGKVKKADMQALYESLGATCTK